MRKYNYLKILKQKIKMLNNSLPRKVPMDIFSNINLLRAILLRESIYHRIKEFAESGYDDCRKDRLIAALVIARALMETEALFTTFIDKLKHAIESNLFDEFEKNFLTKALRGARSAVAKTFGRLDAINVLTFVDKMNKKINGYADQYNFISEFSHPNSAGLNKSYSKLDWKNKEIIFGNNREKIDIDFVIKQLINSIDNFITEYNISATLLEQYRKLKEACQNKQQSFNEINQSNIT